MKFTINRLILEKALKIVSKAAPKSNITVSGAANAIYFQVRKKVLFLWAADGVVGIVTKVGVIDIDVNELDLVLPIDKINHIASYSTTEVVKFKEGPKVEGKVTRWDVVTNSNFRVCIFVAEHFPKFQTKGTQVLKIKIEDLKLGLNKVGITISQDEQKPTLGGICMNGDFVTTDGRRLSIYKTNQKIEQVVLPSDIIDLLSSFSTGEVTVLMAEAKNYVVFNLGDTIIQTRLIEGQFPVYAKILDELAKKPYKKVILDVMELKGALNRLKICRDNNSTVLFDFEKTKLSLQVGTGDVGREELKAFTLPEEIELKLYLSIDALFSLLTVVEGKKIPLSIIDEKTIVCVEEKYTNGEEFYCFISPMVSTR